MKLAQDHKHISNPGLLDQIWNKQGLDLKMMVKCSREVQAIFKVARAIRYRITKLFRIIMQCHIASKRCKVVNGFKKYLSLSLTLKSFYRLVIVLSAFLKIIYLVSLQECSLHLLQNRRPRANCL